MSLYLQQVRGLSAFGAGVVFLPMMLVGAALTPFSARIAERLGRPAVIVAGLALMAAGLAVLAAAWHRLPGVGAGRADGAGRPRRAADHAADHRRAAQQRPRRTAGTASGVFNTSRQVGGALAVAVFGALLAGRPASCTALRSAC